MDDVRVKIISKGNYRPPQEFEMIFGHQEEYGGECWITLVGHKEGEFFQYDFNIMTESELDDIITGFELIKEEFIKHRNSKKDN